MTLAEGAAVHVLPRQPDRRSIGEDRGKGKRLCVRPLDAALPFAGECSPAPRERSLQLLVDVEAGRDPVQLVVKGGKDLERDGGFDATGSAGPAETSAGTARLQAG